MSWQDRDYAARDRYDATTGRRPPLVHGGVSAVIVLVVTNIVMLLIAPPGSTPFMALLLSADHVLHGEVWRLLTACFLHGDGNHLLFNMIGLYFFGSAVEGLWGRRRFLTIYLASGVLANLAMVLLFLVGWSPAGNPAVGASGCVFGILAACAVLLPRTSVLVFFVLPMNIVLFLVLFSAYALVKAIGGDMAEAVHLTGAIIGAAYAWRWSGRGWPGWPARRGGAAPRSYLAPRRDSEIMQAEVDRILAKIQDDGIASLTHRERDYLARASQVQREEEARLGRIDRL